MQRAVGKRARRLAMLTIILFTTILVNAHEFWLLPKKFNYKLDEEIKLDFMVGESFTGEFWDLKKHKVEKMDLHRLGVVRDLVKEVKPTMGNNISIHADQDGTYVFSLQSNVAFIEWEGERFNEYLKEDGLEYILDEREKLNQLQKPAREFDTRFAKLMVQVGEMKDDTFKKRIGLRYEIVPDQNPYSLKTGDYLQCKIFYEGQPAPHTLVKVWSKVRETTFLQNIYTENDGSIRFPISTQGEWMVSSVRMIKSEKEGADYHSLGTSLVFGI